MKKIIKIIICLLISQQMFSQTCEEMSPYKKGVSLEYTNYNKKGKEKSTESYLVDNVTNENGDLTIKIKSTDKKKKEEEVGEYTLKCSNGDFYIDMANYTSLQGEDNNKSFTVKATGDFIYFPDTMEKGTALKDGKIDLNIGDGNSFTSVATMSVLNRKVLDNGSLTTKAGTFDGYKVSFDYVFDLGLIKFRGSGIEWYVKGIGIVKSENYSKKGKLRSARELTKISNN